MNPHAYIGGKENPYLLRWYITPWSNEESWFRKTKIEFIQNFFRKFPNVYVHKFVRDDDDRALHCHPWPSVSIILRGGYKEHMFVRQPVEGKPLPSVWAKKRTPGAIVKRKAELAHRIELHRKSYIAWGGTECFKIIPAWTIFITWSKAREWGFWCVNPLTGLARWIHKNKFLSADGESTGKGCDA